MARASDERASDVVRAAAQPLTGGGKDFDALMDAIGDRRFVLIGEASHGTHEFYYTRAQITQQLIEEKGFTAVIAEADWPDAYRVNRYVRGAGDDADADAALGSFKRFPQWMWRNRDVLNFVEWLKERNDAIPRGTPKCGFYGMDLYSLHASIQAVLEYLGKTDHAAAARARYRYSCFEDLGEDPQRYGYAASFDLGKSCEDEVLRQLQDMVQRSADCYKQDGKCPEDETFAAEQNARVVRGAERYYREMFRGRVSSWNLRDQHMVETVEHLVKHLDRSLNYTKVVIWAHNSHLGDARATEVGQASEWNVGQLMRERHGEGECFLTGFTTHTGSVTCATDWDEPARLKRVRPSLPNSIERVMHDTDLGAFLLILDDRRSDVWNTLRTPRLERAIGVIYRPETERLSHYFHCTLSEQFDALIHFDETTAVHPLELTPTWTLEHEPETYPTGL